MNKFIKVSLIVAGVLLGIGLILGIIGSFGAKKQIERAIVEGVKLEERLEQAEEILDGLEFDFSGKDINIQIGDVPTELRINGDIVDAKDRSDIMQVDADTVKNLHLELGAGTFTVEEKESSDGKIDIIFEGLGNCNYRVEEATLYVEGFKGIGINNNGGNKIVVRIPAESVFDEVDAEVGAGEMTVEKLVVRDLEAEIGAGELKLENMEVEELSTHIGAGRVRVDETVVNHAEVSVAMGECIFEGTIKGNLNADCDMGSMEFSLTGKETDHNYDVSCAAGNVSVGGFEFAALAADREVDNHVGSTFEVNCSMGNIVIAFEE